MTVTRSEKLIDEMKNYFGDDSKRINHALSVLDYAEEIQLVEGGDKKIVDAAAILHDIGIKLAEQKYNSSAGKYQEIEGPPVAKEILIRNGYDENQIENICEIIANHHSAKCQQTLEFKIIWDSDWLVNIPDEIEIDDTEKLTNMINKIFKTNIGKQIAEKVYLNEGSEKPGTGWFFRRFLPKKAACPSVKEIFRDLKCE